MPEGRAGPIVGFSEQLRALERALDGHDDVQAVISQKDDKARIVCCGLACLDLELSGAQDLGREAINAFGEASSRAGGSAPQTASCLADHGVPTTVVAALGDDQQGDELRALLTERGVAVDETLSDGRTGLAVVPVFSNGRGCYFAAGANDAFDAKTLLDGVARVESVAAVLIGYPHLLPSLRGQALGDAIEQIDALVGVDLNGVQPTHYLGDGVADAALYKADVVHANADEASTLLRWPKGYHCTQLARALCDATGAACVVVTDGSNGAAAAVASDPNRLSSSSLKWPANDLKAVASLPGPPGVAPNANGAGDAFFAAFVASTALHDASLDEALAAANEVAHARVFDLVRRPLEEVVAGLRGSVVS